MYTKKEIQAAEYLASLIHKEDKRRGGAPYIEHLEEVVELLPFPSGRESVYAWLHDAVEDHPESEGLIEAFLGRDYEDYSFLNRNRESDTSDTHYLLGLLSASEAVRVVKLADMASNMRGQPTDTAVDRYLRTFVAILAKDRDSISQSLVREFLRAGASRLGGEGELVTKLKVQGFFYKMVFCRVEGEGIGYGFHQDPRIEITKVVL